MRLFIAEKPSLARAIAENLPKQGQKQDGYIICGGDTVTWCFGHLLELFEPDDYDPVFKKWNREQLPIIPPEWKYKARDGGAGKQLAAIGRLLKQADTVVNAGDPDREGQLLVDEVLEHFHTEATRAGVLETLKGRGYLKVSGKALVSTPIAGQVIDLTPPALKDPVTTAIWESRLESIALGKSTLEAFMDEQVKVLPATLSSLLRRDAATTITREGPVYPCPECGKPLQKRTGAKGPYWCCFRNEEHADGKPVFLPDNKGKPGQRKEAPKASEYTCPTCGKPLRLYDRVSKKTGKPFQVFNCSGYPQCKSSYFVKNGKPDFEGK